MKKIGMIGGFGPESTLDYYKLLINTYREQVNDGSNPEIIIYSMDVNRLIDMVSNKQWVDVIKYLVSGIEALHKAGAHFAFISANTPHIVFDEVQQLSPIPLISIVEETCKHIDSLSLKKAGLLGTRFTMQSDFYKRVCDKYNISVFVPNEQEQEYIHDKLMTEIELGIFTDETRKGLLGIIKRMIDEHGIETAILGCTEIPLILTQDEFGIPFINTSKVHVDSIIRYCLI